jgi:hypothetical protein
MIELVVLVAWVSSRAVFAAETADQIIQKLGSSAAARTEQVDVSMAILNPDGSPREGERSFRIQGQYSGKADDASKVLISFTQPRGINGTKILTIKSGTESAQWIYLPALKKTSRVDSDEDVEGVLDSDLSYSDLKGESTETYKYALNSGALERYAEAECHEPAYSVSALPKSTEASHYSKRTLSISKSRYVVCGILLYSTAGKLVKSIENSSFVHVGSSWRPGKSTISSLKSPSEALSKTILTYSGWKTGMKLDGSLFSVNSLSQ